MTLVVGADEDRAYWGAREIRLRKWDPYLVAQGVVIFAFETSCPMESGWPWQNARLRGPIRRWMRNGLPSRCAYCQERVKAKQEDMDI